MFHRLVSIIAYPLFFLGLCGPVSVAWAHAMLERAEPAVGGTVRPGPHEIRLDFSEGVEPALSTVVLTKEGGGKIATGKAVSSSDKRQLILKLGRSLEPGSYQVEWRVISVDTHRTQGSFRFTIGP
jgi:methionine-rich copper-binding protein CopC